MTGLEFEESEPVAEERPPMDRRVLAVLLSWGTAVLMMAGLGSFWIWSYQRAQDRAMCGIMRILTSGPPPVEGEAGDRGRAVLKAMTDYEDTLGCADLLPKLPTAP